MRITGITHTDGTKSAKYKEEVITDNGVAIVCYPEVTEEQLKKIQEVVYTKVQDILNEIF